MEMSKILFCDMESCAYNRQQKCHASSVKIGHPHEGCDLAHPMCDSYTKSSEKMPVSNRAVIELCNEDCCSYNKMYQCTAAGISVAYHREHPDCRTFSRSRD